MRKRQKNGTRPRDTHWSYRSAGVGARRGVGATGNAAMSPDVAPGRRAPARPRSLCSRRSLGRGCADATTSERATPLCLCSHPGSTARRGVDDPAGERGGARARVVAGRFKPRAGSLLEPPTVPGRRPILPPPPQDVGHPPLRVHEPDRRDFGSPGANPTGSEESIDFEPGARDRPFPASRARLGRSTRPFLRRATVRTPDPPSPRRLYPRPRPLFQLAKPQGSEATTADVSIVHTGGTTPRAPSASSRPPPIPPREPDERSYLRVDRQLAAYQDDLLLTMRDAPDVTAILRPTPGTYMVLVTVIDACNSTAQAVTNATGGVNTPVAAVSTGRGDQFWNQRADGRGERDARVRVVARARPGRFPDVLSDDEQYYAYNAVRRGDQRRPPATATAPRPSPPRPPSSSTTAPRSPPRLRRRAGRFRARRVDDMELGAGLGRRTRRRRLAARRTLTPAPRGSNAWRRLFRAGNETADVARRDPDGFVLHAVAPEDGPTARSDPRHFLASFKPDVVGSHGFRLHASNVCQRRRFDSRRRSCATPRPRRKSPRTRDVGLCLARQEVTSTANDTDGDEVHVVAIRRRVQRHRAPAFVDGVPSAPETRASALLSDYAGPFTSFMPDVPGEYEFR